MRVSELIELLSEFPEYYEVKAAGNFVTQVNGEMHSVGVEHHGYIQLDEAQVVVVIA